MGNGDREGFVLIHSYTRREAIEDGVLVDVSAVAREAGIRYPVAVTSAVWGNYVEVPPDVVGQDEQGRLWDVLWMFRTAVQRQRGPGSDVVRYSLLVRNDNERPREVELKAVCGPGDDGEPVVTILLPEED